MQQQKARLPQPKDYGGLPPIQEPPKTRRLRRSASRILSVCPDADTHIIMAVPVWVHRDGDIPYTRSVSNFRRNGTRAPIHVPSGFLMCLFNLCMPCLGCTLD